jgi:cyclin B
MLIASKYEEIYPPEVRDFVYITDKAYTKEEILTMEAEILSTLEYNVTSPSCYRFLELYGALAGLSAEEQHLTHYLIELSAVEYKMLRYSPSLITTAAIYLTNKIKKKPVPWPEAMALKYTENDLKRCAKDLCVLIQGAAKCSLQAIRKKFSSPKYSEVAQIEVFMTSSGKS